MVTQRLCPLKTLVTLTIHIIPHYCLVSYGYYEWLIHIIRSLHNNGWSHSVYDITMDNYTSCMITSNCPQKTCLSIFITKVFSNKRLQFYFTKSHEYSVQGHRLVKIISVHLWSRDGIMPYTKNIARSVNC